METLPPPFSKSICLSGFAASPSVDTDIQSPLPMKRLVLNQGVTLLAFILTGLAIVPLGSILASVFTFGSPHFTAETLTALPAPMGLEAGIPNGFANAILGTLLIVTIASAIGVPFGVMAGIYLAEVGDRTPVAGGIRFVTRVLSSVPSIIAGTFAYAVVVLSTKHPSAFAGGVALSVIMLPLITLTTEESLKLVPRSRKLASMALGASHFQTVCRVILPSALPGIATGIMLSVARAAGEAPPLLVTALYSETWPEGLLSPAATLSVLIYNYATSPFVVQNNLAWTAALVLLALVVITNIFSRMITRYRM